MKIELTKEEIIIDGVNVKDCRRRIGKNSYCRYFKRPCADNNFNCIWKQHERLKEENEKLKQYLLNIAMIIEELEQQYDDIKDFTEIKEIKEILSEVQQ